MSVCILGSARSSGQQDPQQRLLQRTSVSTQKLPYFLSDPQSLHFKFMLCLLCVCVCRSVFMELVRETSRHSLQENMRQITSPVQVIWGKEDEVMTPHNVACFLFFLWCPRRDPEIRNKFWVHKYVQYLHSAT